jgi:peptidyl-tRNA hydrolase, PTH2 family
MYAVLRGDLKMTSGKASSQAGHAFLDSYVKAPPDIARAYRAEGEGTKVVLVAEDEAALRELHQKVDALGLPCALVVESGHVMPPSFDGSPIITALGIGPAYRGQVKGVTGKLRLLR